jgi:cytochrome c-type biogenesis protein CcmH/NrfF
MIPLAHLGHWYFYPLYAVPVVIVLFSAITTTIRERRAHRDEEQKTSS